LEKEENICLRFSLRRGLNWLIFLRIPLNKCKVSLTRGSFAGLSAEIWPWRALSTS